MMLQEFKREQTFDVVYLITPSYESNKSYWEGHILRENVFEPTKDSITQVIARVEQDRDEWERFLAEKKQYQQYQKAMQKGGVQELLASASAPELNCIWENQNHIEVRLHV